MIPSVRVVKLGGEILRGPALRATVIELAELRQAGQPLVIVHGAGPQTSELQQALGQTPRIVGGRRITDDATLRALKMALVGEANVDLCAALHGAGLNPIGLNGSSGGVIRAEKRPPRVYAGAGSEPLDLGHVGDVEGFDRELLLALVQRGQLPVLACLGADAAGQLYNINADIVATRLAIELAASDLFLLMGIVGVLRDKDDLSTRIERLTIAEAQTLIDQGAIQGGMIPKLTESFVALKRGVQRVHLIGKDLRAAAERPGSVGTLLTA